MIGDSLGQRIVHGEDKGSEEMKRKGKERKGKTPAITNRVV